MIDYLKNTFLGLINKSIKRVLKIKFFFSIYLNFQAFYYPYNFANL